MSIFLSSSVLEYKKFKILFKLSVVRLLQEYLKDTMCNLSTDEAVQVSVKDSYQGLPP